MKTQHVACKVPAHDLFHRRAPIKRFYLIFASVLVWCFFQTLPYAHASSPFESNSVRSVFPFFMGPITRTITPHSMTFMAQGDSYIHPHHTSRFKDQKLVGVACLSSHSLDQEEQHRITAFNPEDANVQHFSFDGLEPKTTYYLRTGAFFLDPNDSLEIVSARAFDWSNGHNLSFITPSTESSDTFSLIVGSCRRIGLENFFTRHWQAAGDEIFAAIQENINGEWINNLRETSCIAFIGDQIYADATGFWKRARTFREFVKLYEKAFRQTHFHSLVSSARHSYHVQGVRHITFDVHSHNPSLESEESSQDLHQSSDHVLPKVSHQKSVERYVSFPRAIPIHMMCDDHERKNDWSADRATGCGFDTDSSHAYSLFQRPLGVETENYWFTANNDVDIFYMDTRSERYPLHNQMISDAQMHALQEWLSHPHRMDRIKIIATSVPFFFLDSSDSWAGFEKQRFEVLNYIMENDIRYTMFMSGDAHCGVHAAFAAYKKVDENNITPLTYESADGQTQRSFVEVLSSGLYARSRHKAGHIQNRAHIALDDTAYTLQTTQPLSRILKENLFARITGWHDEKKILVQFFDTDNQLLQEQHYFLT